MTMHLVFMFALLAPTKSIKLLLRSSTASMVETSVAMREMQQVLASDNRFYNSEFAGLEDQLKHLATAVEPKVTNKSAATAPAAAKEPETLATISNPKSTAGLAAELGMLE